MRHITWYLTPDKKDNWRLISNPGSKHWSSEEGQKHLAAFWAEQLRFSRINEKKNLRGRLAVVWPPRPESSSCIAVFPSFRGLELKKFALISFA